MQNVNDYELNNLEAEQGVLGIILLNPKVIKRCYLAPKEMYYTKHRILLKGLIQLYEKRNNADDIDITLLLSYLSNSDREIVGGLTYLTELLGSQFTDRGFDSYQQLVRNAFKVRTGLDFIEKYKSNAGIEELDTLARSLTNLTLEGHVEDTSNYQALVDIHNSLYKERNGLSGIDIGFEELNVMTDGWQGGDLIVLAARPSVGKTAFAVNFSMNACKKQNKVLFYSLEMPKRQVLTRAICAEAKVNMSFFSKGVNLLDEHEITAIGRAEGEVSKWDLVVCEATSIDSVKDLCINIRSQLNTEEADKALIVIDYLQLIQTDKSITRHDLAIAEITRKLKLLAIELNVPIVLLSQLNRGVESRNDKRPMMSDLRDSGSIEQDADIIMLLHREDYYDRKTENKNIIEVDIAKHRNGPVGTVKLLFEKETGNFYDLKKAK